MKSFIAAAALLAGGAIAGKRDLCSDGSVDVNGNWYCQAVEAITYTGVGGTGSYNRVTSMDSSSGVCSSASQSYSGSMSPLDEEVSLHFRGPLKLLSFAAYSPGGSSSKARRSEPERRHAHAHAHAHGHAHLHQAREAQVGATVTATIDGVIETWINEYSGQSSTPAASSPTSVPVAANVNVANPASSAASSPSGPSSSAAAGDWSRQAYYSASSGTAEGLVFLNHAGGQGSGTFDYTFGNSLSYASADGTSGASQATTLSETTLPSSAEVVIMTDNQCGANNGACGYYRDNTVAYHGFDGPSKAFFFQFVMPQVPGDAASEYDPVNMPAIWMLNAQIPRTLQYGNASCSCWESGCGEFDIFEVLAAGDTRMKSTLHGNIAGGDSDYFTRPTDESNPMTAALVLYNNNIHIQVLSSGFDFGSTVSADTINDIVSSTATQTNTVSLFALSG